MNTKKVSIILSSLIALSLILSACAQPAPEKIIETVVVIETVEIVIEGETVIETVEVIKTVEVEVTPVPEEEPAKELVWGQTIDILRFDPYDLAIGNFSMFHTVYDPLLRVNADFVPEPWLAKSWEFNEDGSEMTLSLEEGVLFHSGREMTAEDVKWTIEQYQDPVNAANVNTTALLITGMEVIDDYTIKLSFDGPFPAVFDLLELIFVVDKDGQENLRNTPAGSGPFRLEEWVQGDKAVYVKNEDYWKEGLPKLDKFVVQVFPDQQAMVAALEAGAIDVTMYPSVQDFERLEGDSNYITQSEFGCCETNVNFNTPNGPWGNKLVRQAMNHAIDRQRLVDIAFEGNSYPICQPIRSGWAHNPDITVEEDCKYDLELAKSLLEEAGYGDGFDMEALVSSSVMAESTILAQIMKEDWAELGINVEILDLEQTAYNNMGDKAAYKDMYIQIVGRTNKDPGILFGSTVAFRPETNVAQFRDEEYEGLIIEGLTTADPVERERIYKRLAEILVDESFSLVVAPRPDVYMMDADVTDFIISRDGLLYTPDIGVSE